MASSFLSRSRTGASGTRALGLGLASGVAMAVLALLAATPRSASAEAPALADPEPAFDRAEPDPVLDGARPDPVLDGTALREAERSHLRRVGVWGAANLVAGGALALASGREEAPVRHGFGVQSAGWGAINLAIAAAGLTFGGRGDPPESPGEALAAESRWGQILVLNLGLNAGYAMGGGALSWAAANGASGGDALQGHARAVILQGAGLFALDALAWVGHRERMGAFSRLIEGAHLRLGPGGGGGPGAVGFEVTIPVR